MASITHSTHSLTHSLNPTALSLIFYRNAMTRTTKIHESKRESEKNNSILLSYLICLIINFSFPSDLRNKVFIGWRRRVD